MRTKIEALRRKRQEKTNDERAADIDQKRRERKRRSDPREHRTTQKITQHTSQRTSGRDRQILCECVQAFLLTNENFRAQRFLPRLCSEVINSAWDVEWLYGEPHRPKLLRHCATASKA